MSDALRNEEQTPIKMGVLQIAQLARTFAAQADDLRAARERCEILEAELTHLRAKQDEDKDLLDLGRSEMERLYSEAEGRLRAITLFTRDQDRHDKLSCRLAERDLTPQELVRWHKRISDEFRLLYPTQPVSHPAEEFPPTTKKPDSFGQFRLRG